MPDVQFETISYGDWPECRRLSNGVVELVATTRIGPRVIHFARCGGENLFHVIGETRGKSGGEEWNCYGGHRLWHGPEDRQLSYVPDNSPISAEFTGGVLRLKQDPEPSTGIQKEMQVEIHATEPKVRVRHVLTNVGPREVRRSAWAISVMRGGGAGILPLTRESEPARLLPNRAVALWPYADPADPRLALGGDFIRVRQEAGREPFKIGVNARDGWVAYHFGGLLFVKRFDHLADGDYSDFGASAEIYTNAEMMEIETVGPVLPLKPGDSIEHIEHWELVTGVDPALPPDACRELIAAGRKDSNPR